MENPISGQGNIVGSNPKEASNRVGQAVQMWGELRSFADSARNNFILTAFYEAERRRTTQQGVRHEELSIMHPAPLFHNTLVNRYHFTEAQIQTPLIHILSLAENDPQQEQRRDVYIHVGQDGKEVRVVEDANGEVRERALSADEIEFIQDTAMASNAPATILHEFGSASEFLNLVQIGMRNQRPDLSGIDGVDNTGWTLYDGGLAHFTESLRQLQTKKLKSSSNIETVAPIMEYSRMFLALVPPSSGNTSANL